MQRAPVCNHDLPLQAPTTLAHALFQYADFRKPGSHDPDRGFTRPWFFQHDKRDAELRRLIADQARDAANEASVTVKANAFMRELEDVLPTMENRRVVAHSVARRLKSCAKLAGKRQARDLAELPERMFLCRVDGHAGVTDDGDRRFAFAFKCSSTRFCPDCAREHSMYEAERYSTACLEHVARGSGYRAHQLVMTRPSVPLGSMAQGIAETFAMFRDFLDATRPCSEVQRRKHGWSKRKKKLPVWRPGQQTRTEVKNGKTCIVYDGPGIHGALVQLECHLTAKGAWHPHLNVLVLTKGDFSYALVRKLWHYNVECRPVLPGVQGFARAFAELIKYPFRHVAEKNLDKRAAGETQAPPFEEWPDAAIVEWHAATRGEVELESGDTRIQGSRWLRSYGALHGIAPPEVELQEMQTLARLTFTDDGRYVGSIPGSKFQGSHQKPSYPGYRVPTIRPPPRSRGDP
jgi:hypothetical protein